MKAKVIKKDFNFVYDAKTKKYINLESGLYLIYRQDGTLQEIVQYKNGKRHGVVVSYDIRGKAYKVQAYKNGKRDGLFIRLGFNNMIDLIEQYKNNKPHGELLFFDTLGNLENVESYKNGKECEVAKVFKNRK